MRKFLIELAADLIIVVAMVAVIFIGAIAAGCYYSIFNNYK